MHRRAFLVLSASLNAGLILALLFLRPFAPPPADRSAASAPRQSVDAFQTNLVVRREFFSWDQIESEDYPAYIANLRAIGCPEQTIRDIIVAEVNGMFERRRAQELLTPSHQWWRSDPDPRVVTAASQKQVELERERRALLTRLLGPAWEDPGKFQAGEMEIVFDGPVLGGLSAEAKKATRAIEYAERQAWRASQSSAAANRHTPDPVELALHQSRLRQALSEVLPEPALAEYLLRYSPLAQALRNELRGIEVSPGEFRALFQRRENPDVPPGVSLVSSDPFSVRGRERVEEGRQNALREVLGAERYGVYLQLQDSADRAPGTAPVATIPAALAGPLDELQRLVESVRERLREDPDISPEERAAALESIRIQHQEAIRLLLGPGQDENVGLVQD